MQFKSWLEAFSQGKARERLFNRYKKLTENYDSMELSDLIKLRDSLEVDIQQEKRAINQDNPHADLRSSVAYANIKTLTIEQIKVELEIARKVGDKQMEKFHLKRLKNIKKGS